MGIQNISKLDSATRQLHLGIRLYFEDADPIGVHTLAGASHGLLRDLTRHVATGQGNSARHVNIESSQRSFVTSMVNQAKNFFKHADRDPNSVLQFNANWTDFLVFEAIQMHIELTRRVDRENQFFLIWLSAKYPNVLLLDNFLGHEILELRRLFPNLADQKGTFRAAINTTIGGETQVANG